MAASSFPSLEADDDCGECLLAFAAPCMICSESESACPELPFPPREVVAAVRLGPVVFLLFTITPHSLLRSCSTSAMAVARLSLCDFSPELELDLCWLTVDWTLTWGCCWP